MVDPLEVIDGLTKGASKRRRRKSLLPNLPDPGQIREVVEEIVDGVAQIKTLPQELIGRLSEADGDFKEADKVLRSARMRRNRRS